MHDGIDTDSFKMASNARVGMRSGSPSFVVVGLSLVVVVLLYSYWSVSSRNSMLMRDHSVLQDRIQFLSSKKIAAVQQIQSLKRQLVQVEKSKRSLEEKDAASNQDNSKLKSKTMFLEDQVKELKIKSSGFQSEVIKNKKDLNLLKSNINNTGTKLKTLNDQTSSFMEMFKSLKEKYQAQTHDLFKTKNDWLLCEKKLKLKSAINIDEKKASEKASKVVSDPSVVRFAKTKKHIIQRSRLVTQVPGPSPTTVRGQQQGQQPGKQQGLQQESNTSSSGNLTEIVKALSSQSTIFSSNTTNTTTSTKPFNVVVTSEVNKDTTTTTANPENPTTVNASDKPTTISSEKGESDDRVAKQNSQLKQDKDKNKEGEDKRKKNEANGEEPNDDELDSDVEREAKQSSQQRLGPV